MGQYLPIIVLLVLAGLFGASQTVGDVVEYVRRTGAAGVVTTGPMA